MSHVVTLELEIHDLDALAKAAKSLGLEFVHGQTSYKWFGRSVGDYPVPQGFTADDLGQCQHVLRVQNAPQSYEVGITARRDGRAGWTLLWDFWAGGYGLQDKIGANGDKLKQAYAREVTVKHYQKQGYRVTQYAKADGSIVLKASR